MELSWAFVGLNVRSDWTVKFLLLRDYLGFDR